MNPWTSGERASGTLGRRRLQPRQGRCRRACRAAVRGCRRSGAAGATSTCSGSRPRSRTGGQAQTREALDARRDARARGRRRRHGARRRRGAARPGCDARAHPRRAPATCWPATSASRSPSSTRRAPSPSPATTRRDRPRASRPPRRPDGERQRARLPGDGGLGIDAAMIANTRPELKRRFGWLAYVDAGFRALPEADEGARAVTRSTAGTSASAHVSTILVANCGTLPGNIELIPDAPIDDGLLDIAVLQPEIASSAGWRSGARSPGRTGCCASPRSGSGSSASPTAPSRTELTYLRGASVRLTVDAPEPFELDGDAFGDILAVDLHRRRARRCGSRLPRARSERDARSGPRQSSSSSGTASRGPPPGQRRQEQQPHQGERARR